MLLKSDYIINTFKTIYDSKASLNKYVFKDFLKLYNVGQFLISIGKQFHNFGATHWKDRSPSMTRDLTLQ